MGLLVLALVGALAGIPQDPVTIPLATYSVPEIAEALSTPERRIGVSSTIRNRGALIGFAGRPRVAVEKAICEGLDLQIARSAEGRWVLEPDPRVEASERRKRGELVEVFNGALRRTGQVWRRIARMSPEEVSALQRDLRPLKDDPEASFERSILPYLAQANVEPLGSVLHSAFSSIRRLENNFIADRQVGWPLASPLPEATLRSFSRPSGEPGPLVQPWLNLALSRRSHWIVLTSFFTYPGMPGRSGIPIQLAINGPGTGSLANAVYRGEPSLGMPGLGSDAVTELDLAQARTRAFLATAEAQAQFEVRWPDATALSGPVQLFAGRAQCDVVMELAPIAESTQGKLLTSMHPDIGTRKVSLASLLAPTDGWTVYREGAVLILKNQLAFIDRTSKAGLGEVASLVRALDGAVTVPFASQATFWDGEMALATYQQLRPFLTAQWRRRQKTILDFDMQGYRGGYVNVLNNGLAYLWERLPVSIRRKLATAKEGNVVVPIQSFGLSVARDLQAVLPGMSLSTTPPPPVPLESLGESAVRVTWTPSKQPGGLSVITMEAVNADGTPEYRLGEPVSFRAKL